MLQNIDNQEHTDYLIPTNQNIKPLFSESLDNESLDNESLDKETQCMICYEDIDEINWIIFECKHQICIECLQKLYKYRGKKSISCPFCRFIIEKSTETNFQNNETFYHRFYLNLSQNPIFCFMFNLMSFIICIGMIIIIPSQHNMNNSMSKYESDYPEYQEYQQIMYE